MTPPSRFAPAPEGRHPLVRETLTKDVV